MPKLSTQARSQAAPPVADPDLVDRLFEFLRDHPRLPKYPPEVLAEVQADLREEFRGERLYVAGCPPSLRQERVQEVLRLFNGQNSTEVARKLGIGRTTVFRLLKQAGHPGKRTLFRVDPADRSTFAGNGTPPPIP